MAERRGTAVAARTARPKAPKPMSATQRKTLATQQLVSALAGADQAAAITAALEAVNERLAWDTAFQENLRQRYEEIRALATTKPKTDLGPLPQPKPSSTLATHNPLAKLNPYELANAYEREQLRDVVSRASRDLLREMVDVLQSQEPAAKAPNRSRKADMIDYIVEHVAGPGY